MTEIKYIRPVTYRGKNSGYKQVGIAIYSHISADEMNHETIQFTLIHSKNK